MEIKYLHHSEIDYDKWERCVSNSLNVSIYCHTWFLDCISNNWAAIILDDYQAVMPVFVNSRGKMILPKYMVWTGVYCNDIPDKEFYEKILEFITQRFSDVDIAFDKYFHITKVSRGRIIKQHVCEFDVIKSLTQRKSQISMQVKKLWKENSKWGFTLERVADPINVNIFLQLHTNFSFKEIDILENIVESGNKRKGCVMYYMKDKYGNIAGLVIAVFVENYIFVPFLKVAKKFSKPVGQMVMIDHLMKYFEGCPGILVIEPEKLNINENILLGMGAKKYEYFRLKINDWSKIFNLFHIGKK